MGSTPRYDYQTFKILPPENKLPSQHLYEAGMCSNSKQPLEYIRGSSSTCVEEEVMTLENTNHLKQLVYKRLRTLVEETEIVKAAFWEAMEERSRLMKELHKQEQVIHDYLQLKDQENFQNISEINSIKERREVGILQVLPQDLNQLLVLGNRRARTAKL